ncbi:hypothetical protein ACFQZE_07305 [Paenibacillus sp. GCM10027627]|uniref:hypothetical protein n=1 Tax=unclassified Paenibacillus TaxID=185978 RepID=UPI00362F7DA1
MNHQKLLEIGIQKKNKEIDASWQELADKYSDGLFDNGESFRCWVKARLKSESKLSKQISTTDDKKNYKETIEINKDGSQISDKLIEMSLEQSKNPAYLLKAHGYDVSTWDLISSRSNIWNAFSNDAGVLELRASKITVRPLKNHFNFDRFIESLKNLKPIELTTNLNFIEDKRLLEIPLFDPHFGVSDYDYYKPTQERIANKIRHRQWEQVLFIVGQDMLHNDDFRGRTSSGTPIETVDMEKAWNDCLSFYQPLINTAFKYSNKVKIMYSKGNHDESMSWAFVQLLKGLYPAAEIDDSFIERKAHVFGDNFIGTTHGDKARKNLHNIFPIEFPMEWARAKNREIHIGHLHVEDGRDYFGMMVRTLATRNKTDKWHKDQGYVGAHKRFMLFEYTETDLESIYYV